MKPGTDQYRPPTTPKAATTKPKKETYSPQPIAMETTIIFFPQGQLHRELFKKDERANALYDIVLHCGCTYKEIFMCFWIAKTR